MILDIRAILIANRGEIACRVVRTARRMGIRTVAVYSDADRDALHVAMADAAYRIGPPPARESYLDQNALLDAAKRSGVQAIHPGYGFLAENAGFAAACAKAGLIFIGPPVSAIEAMGGKSEAKARMAEAGVPLVPGYHGADQDPALLQREADRIGYPVLIKASAGGGGKGMKSAPDAASFADQLASARREAAASFGDDRVLLEKHLQQPRHVEIQIFADAHGQCVYLFERDCSIQRRHQKVIEEAPAPAFAEATRRAMGEAAVKAARSIGYVGAGTIEFLYVPRDQSFYFMEMNTRLQVEHPVTEMITGFDLVEWQIKVARGEPLPATQDDLAISGHAIEVRLYAEDPARDFLPQIGTLRHLAFPPPGAHVRVDAGVRAGDAISTHYDPMIAKLVVWDRDRDAAIGRMVDALGKTEIVGLATNVDFLRRLAGHPAFAAGEVDTGFIERHAVDLLAPPPATSSTDLALAALGLLAERKNQADTKARASRDPTSPWHGGQGWRMNATAQTSLAFVCGDAEPQRVTVAYAANGWTLTIGDRTWPAHATLDEEGQLRADLGGTRHRATFRRHGDEIDLFAEGRHMRCIFLDPLAPRAAERDERGSLASPMPGRVIAVLVEPGASVVAGQPLLVVEAMKMEHAIKAPGAGIISSINVTVGEQVAEGVALAKFEAAV